MTHLDYDRSSSSSTHGRASSFHSTKKCNAFRSLLPRKRPKLTFRPRGYHESTSSDAFLRSRKAIEGFEAPKKQFQARKGSEIDCGCRMDWWFQAICKHFHAPFLSLLSESFPVKDSILPVRRFWICSAFRLTSFKSWL